MAKHIVINGKNYRNVSKVELPTSDGGTALFRDAEEVMEVPTETLPISANGEYNVKEYAAVQVAVPTEGAEGVLLQAKTVEPSTVQKVVTADGGYTGLSSVTVEAIPVQEKTVVPSTVEQVITPDSGKYLSRVTVGATAGEPVLAGIAVEPTSISIPYNAGSGELYTYLTAMRGTYTLNGYTGSLERDLTAQLSEITIVGDTPAIGETAAVTLSYGGKTTTVTVTREQNTVAVTGVSLDQDTITLTAGGTQGLLATVLPAIATNQEVSWESSAPTIAKVEKSDYLGAVVTALAAGSATITVKTADGGYTASCAVTVEAAEATGVTSSTATGSTGKTIVDATLNVTQAEALTVEPNKITAEVTYDYNQVNTIKKLTLTKDESGKWNGSVERKGGGTYAYVEGQYATVTISGGKVTAIKTADVYFSESLPSLAVRFVPDNSDGTPAYNLTVEAV